MHTNITVFTDHEELRLDFKTVWDPTGGTYPQLQLKTGVDSVTIYPSFEQVYELQKAINKLVVEMENKDDVR